MKKTPHKVRARQRRHTHARRKRQVQAAYYRNRPLERFKMFAGQIGRAGFLAGRAADAMAGIGAAAALLPYHLTYHGTRTGRFPRPDIPATEDRPAHDWKTK